MAWVWTGNIFLTWGGYNLSTALNDGAKYDPVSNSWLSISTTNAPTARYDHTAVWTGTEMILWGGWNGTDIYNDGFKMTPADNWP
jgi:N-acetylneuraminic acid mutarotase